MKRKSKTLNEAQRAVSDLCRKVLALPAAKQHKVLRFMKRYAAGIEDAKLKDFWNDIYEFLKTSIENDKTEANQDEK